MWRASRRLCLQNYPTRTNSAASVGSFFLSAGSDPAFFFLYPGWLPVLESPRSAQRSRTTRNTSPRLLFSPGRSLGQHTTLRSASGVFFSCLGALLHFFAFFLAHVRKKYYLCTAKLTKRPRAAQDTPCCIVLQHTY